MGEDLEFWGWGAPFYDGVYRGLEGDIEFYVEFSSGKDSVKRWFLENI